MQSRIVTAILAASLVLPVVTLAEQAATSAKEPITRAQTIEARASPLSRSSALIKSGIDAGSERAPQARAARHG